jgi:KEOPS complex subunit Pcc1
MHTLSVELDLGPLARPVYESLVPELQEVPSERSKITLEQSGGMLHLFVAAEDLVSMRAAINTWLRLIRISEDMLNTKVIS